MVNSSDRQPTRARVIAFYLPQFYPIPENDEWWGPGFTEWTNVARARPLYRGHVQPHLPADLGFYDLRLPEVREKQASLAREHGVEGFCYWHYWFAGRRLLERPFEEVLTSGVPSLPFMLGWANQSWTGAWQGEWGRVLVEQTYPGIADHERHFLYLLKAFEDPRYIRVDGKPAFCVFKPRHIPDVTAVTDLWRRLAQEAGLPGLYLISHGGPPIEGFDARIAVNLPPRSPRSLKARVGQWLHGGVSLFDYEKWLPRFVTDISRRLDVHPTVVPNWDNTPRRGRRGMVIVGSTPDLFRQQVAAALRLVADKPPENRLLFVRSWNEWAEGNYLEPDLENGTAYLQAIAREILAEPQHDRRDFAVAQGSPQPRAGDGA